MRKEIIFAIGVGVLFGGVIAFGVWRANSALNGDDQRQNTTVTKLDSQQEVSSELGLTIASPAENEVITDSPTTITGITKPLSWVVISADDEDYMAQADSKGAFEKEVDLTGGINHINIYVFDVNGDSINKTTRLVYSSEFAKYLNETE